jgi:hypothetical protein
VQRELLDIGNRQLDWRSCASADGLPAIAGDRQRRMTSVVTGTDQPWDVLADATRCSVYRLSS